MKLKLTKHRIYEKTGILGLVHHRAACREGSVEEASIESILQERLDPAIRDEPQERYGHVDGVRDPLV